MFIVIFLTGELFCVDRQLFFMIKIKKNLKWRSFLMVKNGVGKKILSLI